MSVMIALTGRAQGISFLAADEAMAHLEAGLPLDSAIRKRR